MSTPATIHFSRWRGAASWPECGTLGQCTTRTDAVTCQRCRRTNRFKEKAAKPIPNKNWHILAEGITGKAPIGGTFTVRVGKAKKTFRHTQVKTAERWILEQHGRNIIKYVPTPFMVKDFPPQ